MMDTGNTVKLWVCIDCMLVHALRVHGMAGLRLRNFYGEHNSNESRLAY
jgi:hypothetical protein